MIAPTPAFLSAEAVGEATGGAAFAKGAADAAATSLAKTVAKESLGLGYDALQMGKGASATGHDGEVGPAAAPPRSESRAAVGRSSARGASEPVTVSIAVMAERARAHEAFDAFVAPSVLEARWSVLEQALDEIQGRGASRRAVPLSRCGARYFMT